MHMEIHGKSWKCNEMYMEHYGTLATILLECKNEVSFNSFGDSSPRASSLASSWSEIFSKNLSAQTWWNHIESSLCGGLIGLSKDLDVLRNSNKRTPWVQNLGFMWFRMILMRRSKMLEEPPLSKCASGKIGSSERFLHDLWPISSFSSGVYPVQRRISNLQQLVKLCKW